MRKSLTLKNMSRYRGRSNTKAIEHAYPHHVDTVVPPGGLGKRLDAMYQFPENSGRNNCSVSLVGPGSVEAGITMLREEFAMRRLGHVAVARPHFKNRQPTAGTRSQMGSLPLGVARTAEHRDVTIIGFR